MECYLRAGGPAGNCCQTHGQMNPQTNTDPQSGHTGQQEEDIHKTQQLFINNSTYQCVYLKIKRSHFQVWMNNGT